MSDIRRPRILCVDHERSVLSALTKQLRQVFDVVTATSAAEGLSELEAPTADDVAPIMIIISDITLPDMSGARFLAEARERQPDAIRLLLTGDADLQSAIRAVNEGQIFRFLTKPCVPQALRDALKAAIEQYRLVNAERELLEKTLRGCVDTLTEILAVVLPEAFGRSTRVRRLLRELARKLDRGDCWFDEVAAMLAPIGYVTLPFDMIEKMYHGKSLTTDEEAMLDRARVLSRELLSHIPRMEEVQATLRDMDTPYAKSLRPGDRRPGRELPWGARALKLIRDFDTLHARGATANDAIHELRQRKGLYDSSLLKALARIEGVLDDGAEFDVDCIAMAQLKPGMLLEKDVTTATGGLIVPAGQRVTPVILDRLRNYGRGVGVKEPIHVRVEQVSLQG